MKTNPFSPFVIRWPTLSMFTAVGVLAFALFTATPGAAANSGWGNALSFDGTDDGMSATGITLTNTSLTIELWARRTRFNLWNPLVCQGWGAFSNGLSFSFFGDAMYFEYYGGGLCTVGSFSDASWHHWAVTHDLDTGERCIYQDGRVVATDTNWGAFTGYGELWLGMLPWSAPDFFGGEMDEVRLWNVARSQAQIVANMHHPLSGSETNLIAYWKFDETSGTNASDSTPNGHLGTLLNGPQWTPSTITPWGEALAFHGTNSVHIPGFGWSAPTNAVTIEFWLRIVENLNEWPSILHTEPSQNTNRILVHVGANYFSDFFWDFGNGWDDGRLAYNSKISRRLGGWQHVAVVAGENAMRVYVNGVLDNSKDVAGNFLRDNYDLEIGTSFVGELDELRIWNVVRSREDIRADMFHQLTGSEANLVAYWNFNEGVGNLVHDGTPQGFDGTLLNDPQWVRSTVPGEIPSAPEFGPCAVIAPNQLRLQATGVAQLTYTLEMSTDLTHWESQDDLMADSEGLIQCVQEMTTDGPGRFYRLSWP